MNLWLALRRLLPLLAVLSLALTPVAAPAATAGMHAPAVAVHGHHAHAMPGMEMAGHAMAGPDMTGADMTGDGMACCPQAKPAKSGCPEGCPLMALCIATIASLVPPGIVLPTPVGRRASMAWPAPGAYASVHGTPLPEPPRA